MTDAMAKEDPRMVFVTNNGDGGYSAEVSPAVKTRADLAELEEFLKNYYKDMIDAANKRLKDGDGGEGEGEGGGGTPGGSSNAKKSRKSYRKKRRKSYKRK